MENISDDKQSENSLQVPESQSTEAHRKERPRHKYVTRTAVPKEYQVDYRRMKASDKSYKKPLELFYGFGVHRTDIKKYCETYIPSELPEPFYLDSATEAAFLRDLRKHCDCRYLALMLAKRDDWNEGIHRDARGSRKSRGISFEGQIGNLSRTGIALVSSLLGG